jgi:hypothetical protein
VAWLAEEALPREPNSAGLEEQVCTWFARRRITRPGAYRLDRTRRRDQPAHDERAFRTVAERASTPRPGTVWTLCSPMTEQGQNSRVCKPAQGALDWKASSPKSASLRSYLL